MMQVLSNEEIMVINQTAEFDSAIGYARKIEAAVLEKFTIDGHFYASNTGSLPLHEAYAGEPDKDAFDRNFDAIFGVKQKDESVPKPPEGYTAEELERDNPYNQWMYEQ